MSEANLKPEKVVTRRTLEMIVFRDRKVSPREAGINSWYGPSPTLKTVPAYVLLTKAIICVLN